MDITHVGIKSITPQKSTISPRGNKVNNQWIIDVTTSITKSQEIGKYNVNINVQADYTKSDTNIVFECKTVFTITGTGNLVIPSTYAEYFRYTEMTLHAISHARALMQYETKGTFFEGATIRVESFEEIMESVKARSSNFLN